MKLKVNGLKEELKSEGVDFPDTYHDLIKRLICEHPSRDCFFSTCNNCPKTEFVIEKIKILLQENHVTEVKFSQWTSTDRYFVVLCFT